MANRILTAEGWQQRIRDKLGIDDIYLPNSVIEQPDHITIAESNIIKMQSNYSSLIGDDLVYLQCAVVCECALLLCNTMNTRLPAEYQGVNEKFKVLTDWNLLKKDLIEERDRFILNISTNSESGTNFFGFDLSGRM